jgi:molybdopterin/thiamine biosynthesis adenylyltransferase
MDLPAKKIPARRQKDRNRILGSGVEKSLQGMTALVTGAAQGVGKGIALELARAGCAV